MIQTTATPYMIAVRCGGAVRFLRTRTRAGYTNLRTKLSKFCLHLVGIRARVSERHAPRAYVTHANRFGRRDDNTAAAAAAMTSNSVAYGGNEPGLVAAESSSSAGTMLHFILHCPSCGSHAGAAMATKSSAVFTSLYPTS